jgi:hypothetical protein
VTLPRATSGVALTDAIRLAVGAALASTHVAFPARVEAYDSNAQTVDVLPQIERATRAIDGSVLREDLPIVAAVPIAWPRSGAFGVIFPLAVGDHVLVVVCDRNIGEWRRTGSAGDPKDVGVHVLDGAVAVPGLFPSSGAVGAEHVTDHLVIGALGAGGAGIHVRSGEVRLGGDAGTNLVALANKVDLELGNISTTLASLTGGGGSAATFGTPYVRDPGGVGATKVRAV